MLQPWTRTLVPHCSGVTVLEKNTIHCNSGGGYQLGFLLLFFMGFCKLIIVSRSVLVDYTTVLPTVTAGANSTVSIQCHK